MDMTDLDNRRLALGDRLRNLRVASGLSGRRLAERAGWPASKVSRIENAKQAVSDSDVQTWCDVAGAPSSVATELRDQLRNVRLDEASLQRLGRGGQRARHSDGGDLQQGASTIKVFELAVVPALVQTAEYARYVLLAAAELSGTSVDIDLVLLGRMEGQKVLYSPGKQIEITMSESALRLPVCPREVLCAQIDRLLALQGLSGVRLGIIPLDTQLPMPPWHGFAIIDDVVLIRTMTGENFTRGPANLAIYHRTADALASVAVTGNQATALLGRIADRLNAPE